MNAELTSESIAPLLASSGLIALGDPLTLTPLPGGVSNDVVLIESAKGRWVLKRALPKLKTAQAWTADVRRVLREADALAYLAPRLEPGAVPRLVARDDARFLIVMEAAPPSARNWKELLMSGAADPGVAGRAGALLGEIHGRTAGDPEAERRFGAASNFSELRLDPYFGSAARARPECAGALDRLVRKLRSRRVCLVHGDYSPKNMLVAEGRLVLLDYEVVHWGDPSFDATFCLAHLLLKALRFPERSAAYLDLADAFTKGYRTRAPGWLADATLGDAPFVLGGMLLARVDGKSPVEYLTTPRQKDAVRCVARRLLEGAIETLPAAFAAVAQEADMLSA